jgi:hypothetical protein
MRMRVRLKIQCCNRALALSMPPPSTRSTQRAVVRMKRKRRKSRLRRDALLRSWTPRIWRPLQSYMTILGS